MQDGVPVESFTSHRVAPGLKANSTAFFKEGIATCALSSINQS